jgi:hypothetical protein
VKDPRILKELADSVYMATSIYMNRIHHSSYMTFRALASLPDSDSLK